MRKFLFLLLCLWVTNAHAQSRDRIYYIKTIDATTCVLYIKDNVTEQGLTNESIQYTDQRFQSIQGVSYFSRKGDGRFKVRMKRQMLNEILIRHFNFTESEIVNNRVDEMATILKN